MICENKLGMEGKQWKTVVSYKTRLASYKTKRVKNGEWRQ